MTQSKTTIPYCTEHSYADYFRRAANGEYENHCCKDRLHASGIALAFIAKKNLESAYRVATLIIEIAKVFFYTITSLFTCGQCGNGKRLWDHTRLLTYNTAALLLAPLQLTIYALAIGVGLLHHRAGYKMLQIGLASTLWTRWREKKIHQEYQTPQVVQKVSNCSQNRLYKIFSRASFPIKVAFLTMISEFPLALQAARLTPLALTKKFTIHSLNPATLSDEQRAARPILLLHGNYHNQSAWLPLAYTLEKAGNRRPVYTLNLPSGKITDKDYRLVSDKIATIKEMYGSPASFEIDLVGHSRGVGVARKYAYREAKEHSINRVIEIGSLAVSQETLKRTTFREELFEGSSFLKKVNFFDILGKKDLLIKEKSCLVNCSDRIQKEHIQEIECGHLDLLSHPESLDAIQRFLDSSSTLADDGLYKNMTASFTERIRTLKRFDGLCSEKDFSTDALLSWSRWNKASQNREKTETFKQEINRLWDRCIGRTNPSQNPA